LNVFMNIKSTIRKADGFKGNVIINFIFYLIFSLLIKKTYSKCIVKLNRVIRFIGGDVSLYFLARSYSLNGLYNEAIDLYERVVTSSPNYIEGHYGLSEAYRLKGDNIKARDILIPLLSSSRRLKTLLLLANLVNTKEDFWELISLWETKRELFEVPIYHYYANDYLITAALRSKQYSEALRISNQLLDNVSSDEFYIPNLKYKEFSITAARNALLDLKYTFEKNGHEFFLISGTLLGCIRNNGFLGHDKDIDVGIWDNIPLPTLKHIIACSGFFDMNPMRSPYVLRIKHVNGISIDIFYHYRDVDNYWHGGSKLKWNNKPFTLVKHFFLDAEFLIPSDYDLYLSENYGDWKIEKKNFDSAFDTKNSCICNVNELKVYVYKKLILSIASNDYEKIIFFHNRLAYFNYLV